MLVLKTFIRNFYSNRLYTLINIMGLAVGLAAFTFILLYIFDELSYDKYHPEYKQVYRLESDITISGKQQFVAKSSYAIGPGFLREFPEVESFVRFRHIDHCFLQVGDKKFHEQELFYTDSTVFDIFSHEFIAGNPTTALVDPFSIVLTESLALKYFSNTDVINKTVHVKNKFPCKITAIIKDLPTNTHLRYSGLVSMPSIKIEMGEQMYNDLESIHFWALRLFTYVKLKEGCTIESIYKQFPEFHNKYIAPISERMNGEFQLLTTRVDRIHLHNRHEWDLPKGNVNTIYAMYTIALFILLIAGINYMNLATAHSAQRAKEVGMRKVLGAHRKQLSRFYIADAILLSIVALILSFVLIEFMLPYFNRITHKSLTFDLIPNFEVYAILFAVSICIGFLSGIYPAYYLSSFQASGVFSKAKTMSPTGGLLRKVLIIFQFTIAIAMIAGSIIITRQVEFIRLRDLGFNKENLLVIRATDSTFKNHFPVFKQKLLDIPNVEHVATTNILPGIGNYMDVFLVESKQGMDKHLMSLMYVSDDFIDALELNIIDGRNFHKNSQTDKLEAAIINKTAAEKLGWFNDAPGKKIHRRGYRREKFKVVGVMNDLVFASLYEKIGPIVIFLEEQPEDLLCIRISEDMQNETIKNIAMAWEKFNPNEPFKYDFLTDLLDEMYTSEFNLNKVIISFAVLALFISLLGLFGLTSYITERSSKNIGIRKILGARTYTIIILFLKNFSQLILISFFIATPIAWIALNNWLDHFAYRIELNLVWFLLSGLLVLFIAQLIVISQTIKSAFTNPVDTIRYE